MGPLEIQLQIDARSHLWIRGDEIWYDHRYGSWQRPGMHSGVHPTTVNAVTWTPVWGRDGDNKLTEPYQLPVKYPEPARGIRALSAMVTWKEGNATACVIEQPRKENDYTTVIELMDKGGGGARWLTFELTWQDIDHVDAPCDILEFQGHRYRVVLFRGIWEECRKKAKDLGGDLACIETAAEDQFLVQHLAARSIGGQIALGGVHSGNGRFRWINGESPEYINSDWLGGPLSDSHPYVSIDKQRSWRSSSQNTKFSAFICEWPGNGHSR